MARRLSKKEAATRSILCVHCGGECEVAARAMSIFCPHCRKRLILEDFKIKSYYAVREFHTCGDVVVEKKGQVIAGIRAGKLTVKGSVQGDVNVRGRVTIEPGGALRGSLEAPMLDIQQGALLDGFLRIGVPQDPANKPDKKKV